MTKQGAWAECPGAEWTKANLERLQTVKEEQNESARASFLSDDGRKRTRKVTGH